MFKVLLSDRSLPLGKCKQVEWRFLAHASDDEPGFSTAWLQRKTLQRAAECRERDYANGILAEFADEFGIADILPTHRINKEEVSDGDEPENERHDVVRNMESPSWTSTDESSICDDRQLSPEVGFPRTQHDILYSDQAQP